MYYQPKMSIKLLCFYLKSVIIFRTNCRESLSKKPDFLENLVSDPNKEIKYSVPSHGEDFMKVQIEDQIIDMETTTFIQLLKQGKIPPWSLIRSKILTDGNWRRL